MKKKILTMAFVSLLAAATFCACSKDDEDDYISTLSGEFSVKVEGGSSYNSKIDTVKLELYRNGNYEVCSDRYAKGGFTLDLPETVPNRYLVDIDDEDESFVPDIDGIAISNTKVKMGWAELSAYKWTTYNYGYDYNYGYSQRVGYFYHETDEWEGGLVYMNGDVTISGTGEEEDDDYYGYNEDYSRQYVYKFSVNAKKGWNILYVKRTSVETKTKEVRTYEYTTQAPANAVWRFKDR
jgi:hypothetical protein